MTDTTLLSIVIAIVGVISSTAVGFLAYNLSRQSQHATIHRAIGDVYSKMVDFRVEHPDVLKLSSKWNTSCFELLYRQQTKADRQWGIYYTYVELCLDFCNMVLYGRKARALDRLSYEEHYEPLVRMILTEHYPFVLDAMSGAYLSKMIREYIVAAEKNGWGWLEKRKLLTGTTSARS